MIRKNPRISEENEYLNILTEAKNGKGEEFGGERLAAAVQDSAQKSKILIDLKLSPSAQYMYFNVHKLFPNQTNMSFKQLLQSSCFM